MLSDAEVTRARLELEREERAERLRARDDILHRRMEAACLAAAAGNGLPHTQPVNEASEISRSGPRVDDERRPSEPAYPPPSEAELSFFEHHIHDIDGSDELSRFERLLRRQTRKVETLEREESGRDYMTWVFFQ